MERSGGKAGRPFGEWRIDQLEKQVRASMAKLDELAAIRAELGYRTTNRSQKLKSLVDRLIREHTGSFDPKAVKKDDGPSSPEEWLIF